MTERPRRIPALEIAKIVREWPTLTGYGPHIAARFGVPLGTAHRWVAETRRRGLLPPSGEHPCPRCHGTGKIRWRRRAAEMGA